MLTAFQEGLEDQDGGEAIYRFAALLDAHFAFAQDAVGFYAGEPFVPKVHRQRKLFVQHVGELAGLFGGRAVGAAQTEG
jgi:hypothetical protein